MMTTHNARTPKSKRYQWLLLSSTALSLAFLSATSTSAQADTTTEAADQQSQATTASVTPSKTVTLTSTTEAKTTDPDTPAPATETDDTTELTDPDTTTETKDTDEPTDPDTTTETEDTNEPTNPDTTTEIEDTTQPTDPNTTTETDDTTEPADPDTTTETENPDATTDADDSNTTTAPEDLTDDLSDQNQTDETDDNQLNNSIAPAAFSATAPTALTTDVTETINDWMPNTLLQNEVLKELQSLKNTGKTWSSVDDITKEDMQLLTKLFMTDTYIDGETAYALDGLEYATNLTRLQLNEGFNAPSGMYYGDVRDLTPLAGLTNLTELNIQNNSISDLTPLANLVNLTSFSASFNHISDFRPLQGLTNLKDITYGNQVIIKDTPIYVSRTDKTANLPSDLYLVDGTKVTLEANAQVGKPIHINLNTLQFKYSWYFSASDKGEVTQDGNGGLNFTNIKEQEPGITGEYNGSTVVPVKDRYFLTGSSVVSGIVQFALVQPYVLYDSMVTVHYQDTQGNTIADDQVLYGDVGGDYTTQKQDIDGYTFQEIQGNATGQFTDKNQEVTYIYAQDPAEQGTVTVHYVDDQGNTIAPDQVLTQDVGSDYTTEQKEIDGYTFKDVTGNPTGTVTAEAQEVTYVYTKDPAEQGTVTVHYVDDQGNTIAPDEVLTQDVGSDYTTEQKEIDGYTFKEVTGNPTGTVTAEAQEVTYVYTADKAAQGTITVHYVDENGTAIAEPTTMTGDEGSDYTTTPRTITGYTLVKTPDNASGKYTAGNLDITYVYQAVNTGGGNGGGDNGGGDNGGGDINTGGGDNGGGDIDTGDGNNGGGDIDTGENGNTVNPEIPTTPTKPTKPTTPGQSGNTSAGDLVSSGNAATGLRTPQTGTTSTPTTLTTGKAAATATPNQTAQATLPQTNEQKSTTSLIGWLAAIAIGGLGFLRFKRREH
ncbi:MucBP domain-containing protein [Levilactobacillus namurensis]|uniref:MucBP domain-containing protein n=1 Tax=Levilactobacillus namurensis TaxID=380393 RepID=UPI000463DA1E|nr:MucBP domain-containing protein [Levilactobacillus namurensis]